MSDVKAPVSLNYGKIKAEKHSMSQADPAIGYFMNWIWCR